MVKNPPANAGDRGSTPRLRRSPGGGNATHSSILAWEIPWTEEPGGYSPWGYKESDKTEPLSTHTGLVAFTEARATRRKQIESLYLRLLLLEW